MKIAVVGGGISGLIASFYVNEILGVGVDIYSKDIGGEYLSGGLKYLHYTPYSKMLVHDLNIPYKLKKVIGAVYWRGQMYLHPEVFWHSKSIGKSIQEWYWKATRGTESDIDKTCMNDPWKYKNEIRFGFEGMNGVLIDQLKRNVISNRINNYHSVDIDVILMNRIWDENDLVINTISFSGVSDCAYKWLYTNEYIIEGTENIWWDYLYMPQMFIHRISRSFTDNSVFNFETTESLNLDMVGTDVTKIIDWFQSKFSCKIVSRGSEWKKIKGHVGKSKIEGNSSLPDNVFLLGRYAQQDSRMTVDKVVERIFHKLNEVKEYGI